MPNLKSLSTQIQTIFNDAVKTCDSHAYEGLASAFSEVEVILREEIQQATKGQILEVIKKLERNEPIQDQELKLIKLWIVGDADYYLKFENNFCDWKAELERIIQEIAKTQDPSPDLENQLHLKALIEDGKRVIYDIAFYLEKKERIKNFEESTADIDKEERQLLAKLLKVKLKSRDF